MRGPSANVAICGFAFCGRYHFFASRRICGLRFIFCGLKTSANIAEQTFSRMKAQKGADFLKEVFHPVYVFFQNCDWRTNT
jgi:hypothetical protein